MTEERFDDILMTILIRSYRDYNFSYMREDIRNEILDIYFDDKSPLKESTKTLIATNLHFIAIGYDDNAMHQFRNEVISLFTKEEIKRVLEKVSESLKRTKFQRKPLKIKM